MKAPPARDRAAAISVTGIEHVLVLSVEIDVRVDLNVKSPPTEAR
jgi:hypothetical protein